MSIKQFYSTAVQRDFARVFQFKLEFFNNVDFGPAHLTYVETAALPGRSITNVPVPYMGLSFNIPGTVTYPGSAGYPIQFRCDQYYDLRSVLEAATFNTFDEANSSGDYNTPREASRLVMTLLDKNMQPVRAYTMFGVYIQSLGDSAYDIKDTGTVQTIQAVIAYQYWRAGTPETMLPVLDSQFTVPDEGGDVPSEGWDAGE